MCVWGGGGGVNNKQQKIEKKKEKCRSLCLFQMPSFVPNNSNRAPNLGIYLCLTLDWL